LTYRKEKKPLEKKGERKRQVHKLEKEPAPTMGSMNDPKKGGDQTKRHGKEV